jgi:hypothetical protein
MSERSEENLLAVRALPPHAALRIQTRRLVPSILEQERNHTVRGDGYRHVAHGGAVIRVCPQVAHGVLPPGADPWRLGEVERERGGFVQRVQ